MSITLITGDCMKVLPSFSDESFDCAVLDPPYNETALTWDRWPPGWPTAVRRVLKRTGSMWVFGSQRMFLERIGEFAGWRFAQDVIWEKHNGSSFKADRFKRVHECALQFWRDDAPWAGVYRKPQFTNDATARTIKTRGQTPHTGRIGNDVNYRTVEGGPRLQRSVIFARSEHGRAVHPTQKPIEIVEPLLLYSCPIGGAVLDCFAGSGTVGVVAQRHGIDATLIEGDQKFVAIACQRLGLDRGAAA
ncbi:site-specific DNA-methyltransferase [Mesorhizobium sp. B1-1-6]|uniref:DNA-methyltransferase n=1 Tax=Mesorhizobium sp. B1-1-6 TaxID=2589978 RepID=UPI0011261068|nr:site-specific DNA-methyltransferase [Mesorhizobium sp. B1-1-6]TPN34780.1 site-specific DNA-methyltransferase [Mesorhizobium sp. B1-1-6]